MWMHHQARLILFVRSTFDDDVLDILRPNGVVDIVHLCFLGNAQLIEVMFVAHDTDISAYDRKCNSVLGYIVATRTLGFFA